ncbi:hypothetical protein HAX54_008951 [Datura stramonium]|uniref:Uncharacterized protein n=1 Tax=Datura stramonium TaxID=4076 RepID=A0ABS8RVV3_DATST|nr:hypothetical protein [Datura stramonium]
MAGWSELPQDLTRLTAHWLVTYNDQVRFICVCTSWRYSGRAQCGRGRKTLSCMASKRVLKLMNPIIDDAISISGCRHQ